MSDRSTQDSALAPEVSGLDPQQVCTLPNAEIAERLAWIGEEILPHAIRSVRHAEGLDIELRPAPGLTERVDHLIALERECCSGISFERAGDAAGDGLRLEIRGADPDAPVFRPLFDIGASEPRNASRAAKAAGVGLLASLFLCCVVPLAAATLLGAAAAPLAGLDHPLPIGVGAVLGGFAAWRWLGRRARRAASTRETDQVEPSERGTCC